MKVFYLFLLLITVQSATAQLSSDEKKIIEYIKANYAGSEELLIESVNINSGTLNVDGAELVIFLMLQNMWTALMVWELPVAEHTNRVN